MEHLLTTIKKLMTEHELPALLIGGHAVTAIGHPRATFDIDLLIPHKNAEQWKNTLGNLHYRLFSESKNFLQFESASELPLPALDLMLVEQDVFESLQAGQTDHQPIPTPSPEAMIALKLHAINQPAREDTAKDWSDIFAIISAQSLSLDDPDFSAIVQKHGGEEAVQKISNHLNGGRWPG